VAVGVKDAVKLGEKVGVRLGATVAVVVSVAVGTGVSVKNRVANACIVSACSVLLVGVAEPPPVFGIMMSGSYSLDVAEAETMNGRLNAIAQAAIMTVHIT
jgi:hypothetical protein